MNTTLDDFYAKLFDQYSDSLAIQSEGADLLYGELGEEAARLANGFHEMHLGISDRVGILMENRYEYIVAEIATVQAGGIVVPIIDRLDETDIRYIIDDADVDILVVGPSYVQIAKDIQADEDVDLDFVVGVMDNEPLPVGFQGYDNIIAKAESERPSVELAPDDGLLVQYTSGTTGTQKGALHTHEGIVANIYSHVSELNFHHDERMLLMTPLGHSAGYCARGVLTQGGTIVLQNGFIAERVLQTIESDRITSTFVVPTMISELLESPDVAERETDTLRTLIYGAAPIPTTTLKEGLEQFGNVFLQLYGLAEVPNLVTVLPKHEHRPDNEQGLDSAGYPVQLADVRICSEENRWNDDVGEVAVESPYMMARYLHEDEPRNRSEGIRTGDLGRIDDEGRVVILDRLDDVIVSQREPIYSTQVEDVIQRHPSVSQVAVIGVPVDTDIARHGASKPRREIDQVPKAVLVPSSGTDTDTADILEFCREHLSEREVPESIDTVSKLPETPHGKIDRKTLRKPYW
jgi:fatty-acyl-CoA synthase/long-chain acyl-CoA synthetase